MKKYPVGIQDFAELRKGAYHYIDKTKAIYELVETGKHFFLSRPRRFGKSLLMSTLKYFFKGERELFEGLWVDKEADYKWASHPVVHLSFSSIGYKDIGLEAALNRAINQNAEKLGVELKDAGLSGRFKELIQSFGTEDPKLVLLIDEYDKPLIDYIDEPELAEKHRSILKNFFSVLKDSDAYLHFFLITGVSKFSKVSVFSDLNHLLDITLVERFATLTGLTQAEVDSNFENEIHELAKKFETSFEEMRQRIKDWYNGYSFGAEKVYNPFSLLSFLSTQRFANFWWESGTPYFLMKLLLKDNQYDLESMRAGSATFESYTLDNLDWLPLLFQTGYLTILDYNDRYRLYTLGYPNLEVKEAFLQHLLAVYRETGPSQSYALFIQLKEALDANNMAQLMKVIDTLFATVPYQIFESRKEAFFHAILHISFSGMGLVTQSEVSTSQGRVDTIVHTDNHIYIIEFKLDEPAEAALAQIREKRYGSPYLQQSKEVIALGISFSSENKSVAAWKEIPYIELLAKP